VTPAPTAAAAAPAAGSDLLAVRGLTVTFFTADGPLTAVDGVALEIASGRTLGLVGESGCGKSVTALSLLGLVPPPGRITGGVVRFEGRDLLKAPEAELETVRGNRISMIFQEPMTSLNPVFTVGDQIAEAFRIHQRLTGAEASARTVEMLARVQIPDPARRARDYPHQLSGGMRQRVMIAMALACRPALLIADEPTTALDVTIQAQILDLILGLQDEMGMAVLFISHDLGVVAQVADEVAVMYAGRIVERAPADQLFAQPLHPYTRGLLETLPRLGERRDRLPAIGGAVPDPRHLPPGCRFSDRCPLADTDCRNVEPELVPAPEGAAEPQGGGWSVACFKAGQ
jgi:oligopeptide/dipeptide ABC transporter ATP-binding protein